MERTAGFFAVAYALLVCPAVAIADYDPMTLFQMLMRADTIVTGEITQVRASTYDLEVRRSFRPGKVPPVLTVRRIDDLETASRWTDYAAGQQVVLFARTSADADAPVTPLGAIGEGEVPRDDVAVYVPKLAGSVGAPTTANVAGAPVTGHSFAIGEFSTALEGFFRCYAPSSGEIKSGLVRLCGTAEIASFREQSGLAGHLAGIAERILQGGN